MLKIILFLMAIHHFNHNNPATCFVLVMLVLFFKIT